jgi:hypothetical protein
MITVITLPGTNAFLLVIYTLLLKPFRDDQEVVYSFRPSVKGFIESIILYNSPSIMIIKNSINKPI